MNKYKNVMDMFMIHSCNKKHTYSAGTYRKTVTIFFVMFIIHVDSKVKIKGHIDIIS